MNTVLNSVPRSVGPLATVAIVAALVLSIAAIVVLAAESNVTRTYLKIIQQRPVVP